MPNVTANGVLVLGGTINYPLTGAWTADLVIDQPDGSGFGAGTRVTVDADGSQFVVGTVDPNRTGDFLDAVHVRLIGGAGGLGTTATARSFVQPGAFVSDVVNALISDSGETLSSNTDAGFLSTNLAAWAITPRPVGQCLQVLIDIVNRQTGLQYNWRILSDGTLWIGQESWPTATGQFDILTQHPADASWDLGVDSPFVLPGTTLADVGQVGRVEHRIEASKIRQFVWQNIPNLDRGLPAMVKTIVKQQTAGIDYLAFYEANVVTQSSDGSTLDVQPIDQRIAGLQRIQLRLGIPGTVAKFAPGTTVMLGFKSGDPSQPYLHSFKGGEMLTDFEIGSAADNVITKEDLTALINAISSATFQLATGPGVTGATTTPIAFVAPTNYGSNTVKVQR